MQKHQTFFWYFIVILSIELIIVSNPEWHSFRIFSKPLITVSLLVFFVLQKTEQRTKILVTTALLSTLIGDVLLIYSDDFEYFFLGGLIAFMCSNIIYIAQFSEKRDRSINFLFPSLILLLYAVSLFWYLMDSLGNFFIPVAIYMASAWIMILFAYLRKDEISDNGYIYVLTGALLLMLSASIVAITRFKSDIPFSRVLIMATHGISQLCLVKGILLSDAVYKKQKNNLSKG